MVLNVISQNNAIGISLQWITNSNSYTYQWLNQNKMLPFTVQFLLLKCEVWLGCTLTTQNNMITKRWVIQRWLSLLINTSNHLKEMRVSIKLPINMCRLHLLWFLVDNFSNFTEFTMSELHHGTSETHCKILHTEMISLWLHKYKEQT